MGDEPHGALLLKLLEDMGSLQLNVGKLLSSNSEATDQRRRLTDSVGKLDRAVTLLSVEVTRLTPIVNNLEIKFHQSQGFKGAGRVLANLASGAAGGTVLGAIITWLSHK